MSIKLKNQGGIVPEVAAAYAGGIGSANAHAAPQLEESARQQDIAAQQRASALRQQRLSIARIILRKPGLIIFDEATSSLDSISEHAIQEAIDPILAKSTSLIIAHRLSTILSADEILVLEKGKIVERGDHETLVKKGGIYTMLYNTQMKQT